jgi:hypothetical protein
MLQGVNAGYLLKAKSTLAAWYKRDPGLLERHHSVRAFELVACSKARLLRGLPSDDQREVSAAVRDVIMATDMRHHGVYVQAVEARLGRADAPAAGTAGAGGALLEMQLLLKCADISNAFKPFGVAREWAVRVTDELFAQGDLERAHGLESTPMCDRSAQSRVALQRGFIDGVVAPLLRGMTELHPGLRPQLEQLEANRRRWDDYTDEALLAEVEDSELQRPHIALSAASAVDGGPRLRRRPPPLAIKGVPCLTGKGCRVRLPFAESRSPTVSRSGSASPHTKPKLRSPLSRPVLLALHAAPDGRGVRGRTRRGPARIGCKVSPVAEGPISPLLMEGSDDECPLAAAAGRAVSPLAGCASRRPAPHLSGPGAVAMPQPGPPLLLLARAAARRRGQSRCADPAVKMAAVDAGSALSADDSE